MSPVRVSLRSSMTRHPLRPLVFDLDGTLIDSRKDIARACNHALVATGRESVSPEFVCSHVGSGARALFSGVVGRELDDLELDSLLKSFHQYYVAHPTDENSFMAGAEAALELRASRPIALCTNKPLPLTRAVLRSLDWAARFDSVVAPQAGDRVKPDAQLLMRVAEELQVRPERLIMIGDGPQDVGAGRAVGAHTIGVRGGLLPVERLIDAGPDVLLDSLEELLPYLSELDRSD